MSKYFNAVLFVYNAVTKRGVLMRNYLFVSMFLAVAACGDDGGSAGVDGGGVDAAPDGPAALTGLGQKCVVAMQGADCPQTAPGCLSYVQGATMGVCTNICVKDGTFMTNNATPVGIASFNPDPSTKNGDCAALYTGGSSGVPTCSALTARTPTGALVANTTYTFSMACEISCGAGNTCPAGLTCNTDPAIQACTP